MRIGVLGDTHDNVANVARIVELFDAARVERVVHTGDITRATTLEVLGKLSAPIWGVYGNNDVERDALEAAAERLDIRLVDPPLRLEWSERTLSVVHDPFDITQELRERSEILLHGHIHRRVIERENGRLTFNPGECAGMMEGHNAVGVVDLATLAAEILLF
jgi:putative phosphoesterase